MSRTHQGLSTCQVWKRYCQWSFCNELKCNNRFDLETWNLQGQGHRQRSQWVELIKVYLHVKFERGIVNGYSAMNLNARAKPNCWRRRTDRQADGQHPFIDRILLHNPAKRINNITLLILCKHKCNGTLNFSSGYQNFKPMSPFGSWEILANFHPCMWLHTDVQV